MCFRIEEAVFCNILFIACAKVFNHLADVGELKININDNLWLKYPIRFLALSDDLVIFSLILKINLFFNGIILNSIEILFYRGCQSRCENVLCAVFLNAELIDCDSCFSRKRFYKIFCLTVLNVACLEVIKCLFKLRKKCFLRSH